MWEERGGNRLLFSRSEDGGRTFSEPAFVVPGDWDLSFGQIRLASGGPGDLQAVFTSFNTSTGGAEIVHVASSDAGETFPSPRAISAIDFWNSVVADVATGWGVAVVWTNSGLDTGVTTIDFSVSLDGGETFSIPKRIDTTSGDKSSPAVGVYGDDDVYVAWVQNEDPLGADVGSEIVFSRSTDGGVTFSAPANISNNSEKSWPPRMAVDHAGAIYLVWPEGDFTADMKLLFSTSLDGGITFSEPRLVAGPMAWVEGCIAAMGDGVVWLAWGAWASPYDPFTYESYVARSLDGGMTFSAPAPSPGAFAIASTNREELFIAWHEALGPEDPPEVFVTRGEAVLCGDANVDGTIAATDALVALQAGVGAAECLQCRCDVNAAGGVSATDALLILSAAVGQPVMLDCPPCGSPPPAARRALPPRSHAWPRSPR